MFNIDTSDSSYRGNQSVQFLILLIFLKGMEIRSLDYWPFICT